MNISEREKKKIKSWLVSEFHLQVGIDFINRALRNLVAGRENCSAALHSLQ